MKVSQESSSVFDVLTDKMKRNDYMSSRDLYEMENAIIFGFDWVGKKFMAS